MEQSREASSVRFIVNGRDYEVTANDKYTPETKLVDFIRDDAGLKGTKYMCREGGCGACVVSVRTSDPKNGSSAPKAVNSCLAPLFSCNGWDISTVENLGNKKDGYHPVQERLVKFSGTQCGFCSPGMVMSMYSMLEANKDVKVEDVANCLDGNICRCTGYRPILDAFKSLAVDAPKELLKQYADIEDCGGCPCPLRKGNTNSKPNSTQNIPSSFKMELSSGQQWIKAADLNSAFNTFNSFKAKGNLYRVVAGNTGSGIFRSNPMKYYLDIKDVPELKKYSLDTSGVVLGSCTTLSNAIELLKKASLIEGYAYTKQISKHLGRVANVPVRNIGTLGGNLMLKHTHKDFPSDIFTLMEAVGAKILVASDSSNSPKMYTMVEFLNMDMEGKLVISLYLPQRKGDYRFRSFKITRRYQNAHAYINAGILIKLDAQTCKVLEKPRIVFGGVSADFVHASGTELALMDKCLSDEATLKSAMQAMEIEIHPNHIAGEATPSYRKSLCKSLLYKTILDIVGDKAKKKLQSGGKDIVREVGKAQQSYEADNGTTALYKAMPKLEATFQVSGEAEYINDIPSFPNQLWGAFVLSTVGNAELQSVDATEALLIKGVHRFIDVNDIPGVNNTMIAGILPPSTVEPIFVRDKVETAGQAIGLILASSRETAVFAASKVKVNYKNKQTPIVNIHDALKKIEKDGTMEKHVFVTFKSKKTSEQEPKHTIKGKQHISGQYHYHMETHACSCVPKEDSLEVYSGTQWMDHTQTMIAAALNVPNNYINLHVKRIGGGFGAKLTRSAQLATVCAVAAHVTNRPVKIVMDMETNMKMIGKRTPYLNKYEVKFDENGKIQDLKSSLFCDAGWSPNEADSAFGSVFFQNVYAADGWEVTSGFVTTNTPANTFCRAPGSLNAIALIEYIMEHIAFVLKKDPFDVRAANYRKEGDPSLVSGQPFKGENFIPRLVEEIKVSGEYEKRKLEIEKFNQENRWKKRGMGTSATAYVAEFLDSPFPVYVTIYHTDGTIAVTHGGIEMGQGLNTKVAQTVAHTLQVPLDKIKIKVTNNLNGSNAFFSGGSIASELCCDGAMKACQVLLDRMKPIKETLDANATWEAIVTASFAAKIDLSSHYTHGPLDKTQDYLSWVVNLSEVEVDVLTGEYKVVRVDLLEDAGKSLSPLVDIGQIEGGYLMGQGLWTMENILFDKETGQLLTNRTWNYKAPEVKDVPEDFRVTLLRNVPNPYGVLRSKAVGEPPICSSVAVAFALQNAISSARKDAGNEEWYQIDGPVTPEDVLRLSLTSSSDFAF